ncbi:unnamed protein product [Meganyctiphanes norvegica]|uniref:Uncharacterized protein n=1 Tax=Meganyctiphanes norvegica TaxID=48144 RepID=A0AAV2RJG3_MEGNR
MARLLLQVTLFALVASLSLGNPEPEPHKKKGVASYGQSYGPPQPSYHQPQPVYRPQPVYAPQKAKAPKFKLPKLKLPKLKLPKLPKLKLPKFKLPKLPKLKAPKFFKGPKKGAAPAYYAPAPQPVYTPSYSQPSYGGYH